MDLITSAVHSISTRAGPVRNQEDLALEMDLSISMSEIERRRHHGIEEDFSPEKQFQEVNSTALKIMDTYKALQQQIRALESDFNKDEDSLLRELRELESRNKESMRNYKEAKALASQTKETLQNLL